MPGGNVDPTLKDEATFRWGTGTHDKTLKVVKGAPVKFRSEGKATILDREKSEDWPFEGGHPVTVKTGSTPTVLRARKDLEGIQVYGADPESQTRTTHDHEVCEIEIVDPPHNLGERPTE
jgi:hypothetical protein